MSTIETTTPHGVDGLTIADTAHLRTRSHVVWFVRKDGVKKRKRVIVQVDRYQADPDALPEYRVHADVIGRRRHLGSHLDRDAAFAVIAAFDRDAIVALVDRCFR